MLTRETVHLDTAGHSISFWRWIRGVECPACEIALQASLKRLDAKMAKTGTIRGNPAPPPCA